MEVVEDDPHLADTTLFWKVTSDKDLILQRIFKSEFLSLDQCPGIKNGEKN